MRQNIVLPFSPFKVSTALFLILLLLVTDLAHGQYLRLTRESVKQLKHDGETIEQLGNPLKLGVSVGYNYSPRKLYTMAINPVDNTIQFEQQNPTTVVLSTAIMFNWRTYSLRKKIDPNGPAKFENTKGPVFLIPSRWSIGAVVNIAKLSSEPNLYNQQIDGGLGIGYELNENIFILGSLEYISVKQPREYFVNQYKDKNLPVMVNGAPITAFNYEDTNIFVNKGVPSISLKIVFGLALTKPSSIDNASASKKAAASESTKEKEEIEKKL